MMPCNYKAIDGLMHTIDLDCVVDVVAGMRHDGWSAIVVFEISTRKFVELRSSPPDVRGYSAEESEEVDETYIQKTYALSERDLASFRSAPRVWRFVDQRSTIVRKA